MKKKDMSGIVLRKMIGYCDDIENFILQFGESLEVYQSNHAFRYACDMCILQIGELTTRLTEEFKNQHPEIIWREINKVGNIIFQEYEKVDPEIMWDILNKDIPELKAKLTELLKVVSGDE